MIALAFLALVFQAPAEQSPRPLLIFVEHFGSDLAAERAGLSLASACRESRPVSILARRRGRVDHLTHDGAVVSTGPRADLYSALAGAFRDSGKGADVVYVGSRLPLGSGSRVVSRRARSSLDRSQDHGIGRDLGSTTTEFHHVPRTSLAFDRTLAALRRSGVTFHGVSFTTVPDDGMRLLAETSGGEIWTAPGASIPSAALDRLCR
ncbi:MAG: hypothetical protein ABR576_10770 [Thermoanaerobaculia bacterium]